jgi:hypothetical protein
MRRGKKMVNVNNVYASGNWLAAADLQGHAATVVIQSVALEQFNNDGRPENKIALQFQGKEKRMLCNKTNAKRLAYMFGDETDHWIGKQVTIIVEMVDFKGDYVPALRIQAQQQPAGLQHNTANPSPGGMVPVPNAADPANPNYTGPVGGGDTDDEIPFGPEWR